MTTRFRASWTMFPFLVAMISACGASEPPPSYPAFQLSPSFSGKPTGRFVQTARATQCTGAQQPAVIDYDGPERQPVWSCLDACNPGEEPVTTVYAYGAGATCDMTPSCVPICAPGTHRLSWATFEKARCVPGDPAPADAAQQAAEQTRLRALDDAASEADLDAIDGQIRALEALPRPWSEAAALVDSNADEALKKHERRWARVHPAPRVTALRSRLGSLTEARNAYYTARKRQKRTASTRDRCDRNCDFYQRACKEHCASMDAHACEACTANMVACERDCDAEVAKIN